MKIRNIQIAYVLSSINYWWFWLGVWVFFYLQFTNYAGIGLIEAVMITTATVMEIPSGALADLLGKKRMLTLSFFLFGAGNVLMAFASSFAVLIVSVILMSLGGAFYSGTFEALVYDSLKEQEKESAYDKVISNIRTIVLVSMAATSIMGGFFYDIFPGFPFLLTGVGGLIGFVLTFFLKEPKVNTNTFSFNNFYKQTKQGLSQLFFKKPVRAITIFLLIIGLFMHIPEEILDDVLAVEFGFAPEQLGILWGVILLVSAAVSQLTPYIKRNFEVEKSLFVIGVLTAITLIVSPWLGLVVGGLSLIIRVPLRTTYHNLVSIIVNENTESRYRATTLSTFSLIRNLPYVAGAYFIGVLMDVYTAKVFAFALGVFLLLIMCMYLASLFTKAE